MSPPTPQNTCCGVDGPSDWQTYTSVFRTVNKDADFPWPRQCCVMDTLGKAINVDGCKLGVSGYYHNTVIMFCLIFSAMDNSSPFFSSCIATGHDEVEVETTTYLQRLLVHLVGWRFAALSCRCLVGTLDRTTLYCNRLLQIPHSCLHLGSRT